MMNVQYAMIGERTGNVFRIGDEITVRVISVNKKERSIDFEIVGMKERRKRDRESQPRVVHAQPNKKGKTKDRSADETKKSKKRKSFTKISPNQSGNQKENDFGSLLIEAVLLLQRK